MADLSRRRRRAAGRGPGGLLISGDAVVTCTRAVLTPREAGRASVRRRDGGGVTEVVVVVVGGGLVGGVRREPGCRQHRGYGYATASCNLWFIFFKVRCTSKPAASEFSSRGFMAENLVMMSSNAVPVCVLQASVDERGMK